MKMIIGLGNPGPQYAKTRHNAGFLVIDRLLRAFAPGAPAKARFNAACVDASVGGERCLLLKPTTYMNRSGQSVAEAVRFYKIALADVLVIVDDIYLPVGALRLRPGGGDGGHNGLEDLQRALGSDAYPRLRVGVGLRPDGGKPPFMDQADFVLAKMSEEDEPYYADGLDKAAKAAEAFASKGLAAAMNTFNTRPDAPVRPKRPRPEGLNPPDQNPTQPPVTD